MSYIYTMLESPLPVSDYNSSLSFAPDGRSSKLIWTGDFKTKGVPDAKAEKVIGGIYEGGFKGLADTTR